MQMSRIYLEYTFLVNEMRKNMKERKKKIRKINVS